MAGRSPAHGFCDDEQTRRLLRSRPPRQALAWAGAYLGGPVTSARALRGGMSSAVHLVTARRADGRRAQAVLRRYVRPDPDEPDPAAREARALRLAGAAAVLGRQLGGRRELDTVRGNLALPTPARPAPPLPAGTS